MKEVEDPSEWGTCLLLGLLTPCSDIYQGVPQLPIPFFPLPNSFKTLQCMSHSDLSKPWAMTHSMHIFARRPSTYQHRYHPTPALQNHNLSFLHAILYFYSTQF